VILVVCAVRAELRGFAPRDGVDVVACGVGPVEAAAGTARALALGGYDTVVNAGIGGAFRGRARIGDAVLVAEERFTDLGLEDGGPLVLPGGERLVDRAHASDDLLARCVGLPYRVATGVTVARVTTTDATARRLALDSDADVESMEGFAVLRACERAGVPAIEVRGISNYVGDRATSGWDFAAGSRAATLALAALLDRLGAGAAQLEG
jgi:futalosine hydrolase